MVKVLEGLLFSCALADNYNVHDSDVELFVVILIVIIILAILVSLICVSRRNRW